MKRVFLIILDSFGIGAAPDADKFGDARSNTLKSLYNTGILKVPNLEKMGLGNIDGVDFLKKEAVQTAAASRLRELSLGKDTTVGHWELAGIISESPLPTYPQGFPNEVIDAFEAATGKKTLCNKPYSGTDVIRDYGKEHIETGNLIVYTSQDSVFQIAAHEEVVPLKKLYEYCETARAILTGKHSVGRVIARPFITENDGSFKRTANRRDFSLMPPKDTMLDAISGAGLSVISVGKINDIFAAKGITEAIPTHSNFEGMEVALRLLEKDFSGLAFINLVEFDSHYGHRQDAVGYTKAINDFDSWLPSFCKNLQDDDALIITADHGCDPSDSSTDHTREYVPLLVYGKRILPKNLGTYNSFATVAKLVTDMLSVEFTPDKFESISKEILT